MGEIHLPSLKDLDPDDPRSKKAILAERILRAVNDGHLSSETASLEYLKKRAGVEEDERKLLIPLVHGGHGIIDDFEGMDIVTYGKKIESECTVIYLHGGAYTDEILPFHLNFCSKMAEHLQAYVIVPLYPLTPNHVWQETYRLLTDLYRKIRNENSHRLTIMGDSAGGGLAIGFCQYLKTIDLPQPDHLIGLSPWVDVSMTDTDYEPYRSKDPMLDVPGLQAIGKVWAADLDVKDPKISPVFGDNSGLPKTLLFVGTREIFYPDVVRFYEKMVHDGCAVELIAEEGMNHVYPLYGLPESKAAITRIYDEIRQ